ATTGLIYLAYAEPREGAKNGTSVARAKLVEEGAGARLEEVEVIFRQQPSYASSPHFGSRIVFMPDPSLYVTLRERYSARTAAHRGAEPSPSFGQARAPHARREPLCGQPKEGRLAAGDLVHRPPQRAGCRTQSGVGQAVDHRARGARRRRDQHPRSRQELRLAGHHLWSRL